MCAGSQILETLHRDPAMPDRRRPNGQILSFRDPLNSTKERRPATDLRRGVSAPLTSVSVLRGKCAYRPRSPAPGPGRPSRCSRSALCRSLVQFGEVSGVAREEVSASTTRSRLFFIRPVIEAFAGEQPSLLLFVPRGHQIGDYGGYCSLGASRCHGNRPRCLETRAYGVVGSAPAFVLGRVRCFSSIGCRRSGSPGRDELRE